MDTTNNLWGTSMQNSRDAASSSDKLELWDSSDDTSNTDEMKQQTRMWNERWKVHPLNRSQFVKKEKIKDVEVKQGESWDSKFDMERFVLIRDAVLKFARLGRMVTAKKPQRIHQIQRNGYWVNAPYQTFYEGKFEDMEEDTLYCSSISTFTTDRRADCVFTIGNFEAALRILRPVWRPRCSYKRSKDNWQYVIFPACFEFLRELKFELNGYAIESVRDFLVDEIPEQKQRVSPISQEERFDALIKEGHELDTVVETIEEEYVAVPDEYKPVTEETVMTSVRHGDGGYHDVERQEDDILPPDEVEISERLNESIVTHNYTNTVTDKAWLRKLEKWYPRVVGAPARRVQHRVPRTTINGVFFDGLAEVYMRIGRPDLYARIQRPIRNLWVSKLLMKRLWPEYRCIPREQLQWEAQMLKCVASTNRTEAQRMLTDVEARLRRHRDKMNILCKRGRWSGTLGDWDLRCYERQQRILLNLPIFAIVDMRRRITKEVPKLELPRSYPEQAERVLRLVTEAIHPEAEVSQILKALRAIELMSYEWAAAFDERRTRCWEAQGDKQPTDGAGLKAGPSAPAGKVAGGPSAEPEKDVPVKKGDKKVTMTMVDARKDEVAKVPEEKMGVKHKETDMERLMSLMEVTKRPQFIQRLQWTTAQELGSVIWAGFLPHIMFRAETKEHENCSNIGVTQILSMFGSATFDMVLKIQVNTVKFQQGKIMLVFKPYYDTSRKLDTLNNAMQFPHVMVDASTSNPVTLKIPWTNVRDSFPLYADPHSELNYFGTAHILVWNPLMTGKTGSTDATITLWAWLENFCPYQLTNVKPRNTVYFANALRLGSDDNFEETKEIEMLHPSVSHISAIDHWEPQGLVDSLVDTGVSMVKDMGMDLVEHVLDNVARGPNSKPHGANPPAQVVPQAVGNIAMGEGVDMSHRLSLKPLAQTPFDKDKTPPANFKDLFKKETRIRVGEWRVSDTEGSRIMLIPVTPMVPAVTGTKIKAIEGGVTEVMGQSTGTCNSSVWHRKATIQERSGSMLDYLSRMFLYWRGSLVYRFEVVCTGMHSGRLLVRYEPFGVAANAEKECQKLATPGVTWDVQEATKELKLSAPYMSTQPMLETSFVSEGSGPVTSSLYSNTNGLIELTVVNRLKVTTGISDAVQINIYMSAGADFEFAFLNDMNGIVKPRVIGVPLSLPDNSMDAKVWYRITNYLTGCYKLAANANKVTTIEFAANGKNFRLTYPKDHNQVGPWMAGTHHNNFLDNILAGIDNENTVVMSNVSYSVIAPRFESFHAAYQWLRGIDVVFTEGTEAYYRSRGYDREVWDQRFRFWGAMALCGLAARKVKWAPDMPDVSFIYEETIPAPKENSWEPQGKVEEQAINPFLGFVPPTKSVKAMYGEDYKDMYACLKRWNEWISIQLPPAAEATSWDDPVKKGKWNAIYEQINHMTTWEIQNTWMEMRIPVTPATYVHHVGLPEHVLVHSEFADTGAPIGDMEWYNRDGNSEMGNLSLLTHHRMLSELFTFWRGSLRYMVTIPHTYGADGDTWTLEMAYNPTQYTSWDDCFGAPTLVPDKIRREKTKMGKALMTTQMQTSLAVEVPYVSRFNRLAVSPGIQDATTTSGTLFIYVPLHRLAANVCKAEAYDLVPLNIDGLRFNIFISVGDDFEFAVPRAAPRYYMWNNYYARYASLDQYYVGNESTMRNAPSKDPGGYMTVPRVVLDDGIAVTQTQRPYTGIGRMRQIPEFRFGNFKEDIVRKCRLINSTRKHYGRIVRSKPIENASEPTEQEEKEWEAQGETVEATDELDGAFESVLKVSKELPAIMKDFREFVAIATDTVQSMRASSVEVSAAVSDIRGETVSASSVFKDVVGKASTIGKMGFNAARVAMFFKGIADAMQAKDWSERWIPLATCALALGLQPDLVKSAGEWLLSVIGSIFAPGKVHEELEAQSVSEKWEETWDKSWAAFIEEHIGMFRIIAAGVVTIAVFYFTSSEPTTPRVAGFAKSMIWKLKNMATVGAGIKTLDWLFRWIGTVIKTAFTSAADWATGGQITAYQMSSHYPEVIEWIRGVEIYKQEATLSELAWNADARLLLWKKMDEGNVLLGKISSRVGHLYNTICTGMKTLQSAHDSMVLARGVAPVREDPWHLCLTGDAGVGKSALLSFIMNYICDRSGIPLAHRFYARADEDDYWSSYYGQSCVFIDDLYNNKESVAIKELVKMKSNVAWPVNMAGVNEKGRMFSSKLIASTTNVMFPYPEGCNNIMSIWRRRNLLVEVTTTKPLTADGKCNWKDLSFRLVDPVNKEGSKVYMSEPMKLDTFLVVATMCYAEYAKNQKEFVFASLSGKFVQLVDYGEEETNGICAQPVETPWDAYRSMIDRRLNVSEEYVDRMLRNATAGEVFDWESVHPHHFTILEKSDKFKQWRREVWPKMVYSSILQQLKIGQDPTILVETLESHNFLVKKELGDDVSEVQLIVNGIVQDQLGSVRVKQTAAGPQMTIHHVFEPQGQEDFLQMLVNMEEDPEKESDRMLALARESVERREALVLGFNELVAQLGRRPKLSRKYLQFGKRDEVSAYVSSSFPGYSEREREEITDKMIKVFDDVGKRKLQGCAESELARNFKVLFEARFESKWSKNKAEDWVMKFDVADSEDDVFLYETMLENWSAEEINSCRRIALAGGSQIESSYCVRVRKYFQKKRADLEQWMLDHPQITSILKIGLSAAVLFASYKVLSYICPSVIEKIKCLAGAVFGWGVSKIGEEKVEKAVAYTRNVKDAFVSAPRDFYEYCRRLMKASKDPIVVDAAEDEGSVQRFAEHLIKRTSAAEVAFANERVNHLPEAKKHINMYMIAQDRMAKEGKYEKPKEPPLSVARQNSGVWAPQGATDPNAANLRSTKILRNLVRVRWSANNFMSEMCALFVDGRTILVPYHFFAQCPEGTIISLTNHLQCTWYDTYSAKNGIKIPDQDAMVYELGIRIPQHKSLLESFVKGVDLTFSRTEAYLSVMQDGGMENTRVDAELTTEISYTAEGMPMRNAVAWEYAAATRRGDCGGVLLANNTRIQRKILGIHVCGVKTKDIGSSTLVTYEKLQAAIDALPKTSRVVATDLTPSVVDRDPEEMKVAPQGNFEYLGAVSPRHSVRLPMKTEIEPSPIHGLVRAPTSFPAILTKNDPRNKTGESPLIKALSKYGTPTVPFPRAMIEYVAADIRAEVMTWKSTMGKRKLTDWEGVYGNEMIEYCDRSNLNASPGYPWITTRPSGEKGRAYLYDIDAEDGIASDVYRAAYRYREEEAKQGRRVASLWTDCLKDERRPLAKIEKASTRAFVLPPADLNQLGRKYFMAFCTAFYSNHINSFSAVGVDAYSYDWTRIARKLRKKSSLGFGGDFHSFDGIFDPDIMWEICKIINAWYREGQDDDYEESDDIVREVLFEEFIHTMHICLNSVYQDFQGNPSGCPLTVIVNTFAHCFYIRLAWMEIMMREQPDLASMFMFHRNVAEIYYGDDGLLAVKHGVVEWFNLRTVSEQLARHKIEYTSENKNDVYEVRNVMDCTFLKNGFCKMDGYQLWLAPMAKDTIYELTNWVRKSDDSFLQMRENLENALSFAMHHGRDFFGLFAASVNAALRARRLREIPTSYDLTQQRFLLKCNESAG